MRDAMPTLPQFLRWRRGVYYALHVLQAVAPASDVVPLEHEMQPLAPLVAMYMPLGHGRHAVPPTTMEYVPGLH